MLPFRKVTVDITNRTILRLVIWSFLAILAYHFIGRVTHALTLIFISFFLAMALNPVVGWMSRHLKIKSRASATAAAYITVVVILAGFFVLITPPLVNQTREFINNVPQNIQDFQTQDNSIARTVRRYHLDQKLTQGAKDFAANYSNFGGTVFDTGKRIAEAVVSVLIVLVLTFMMLVEGPQWPKLVFNNVAKKNRARYENLSNRIYRAVTSFANGQVILALVAASFAFIALEISSHILNVSVNAFALAGIVAMFGIIPLFGNPIAAVLVCLICLLTSGSLALVMLIYFFVYFFVENHTFQPYLQSRLNELSPLTVLVAALLGAGFGGFLGVLIAIPVASTVKILIEDYFAHRNISTSNEHTAET